MTFLVNDNMLEAALAVKCGDAPIGSLVTRDAMRAAVTHALRVAMLETVHALPMRLDCPACHRPHVDAPEPVRECGANGGRGCSIKPCGPNRELQCAFCGSPPRWDNPPHTSHECQHCGHMWRPSDALTTGVLDLATFGSNDSPPVLALDGVVLLKVTAQTRDPETLAAWREAFDARRPVNIAGVFEVNAYEHVDLPTGRATQWTATLYQRNKAHAS
jgi:hypothetical protein